MVNQTWHASFDGLRVYHERTIQFGLDLGECVCPGKKFNGILNWGYVTGVADELGGIDATEGGV